MKRQIAFITPSLLPMPPVQGGAMETLLDHLLRCNEKAGDFDITVFCTGGEAAKNAAAGYRLTRFVYLNGKPFWPTGYDLFIRGCRKVFRIELSPERAYAKRVARALSQKKFDAVIVENQPDFLPLVRRAAFRAPVWLHLHNHPSNFGRKAPFKIAGCDGVIAVSDFVRREILRMTPLAPEQAVVLPNCVDVGRFDEVRCQKERAKIRSHFGVGDDDVLLLYSGRLVEQKGVDKLMEAFLKADAPNLKLMLAGSGWYSSNGETPFVSRLKNLADKAPGRVFLTGYIPFSEMPRYYAAADICAVPSICEEASGLTVLEAMAAGKPLIVTDAGGIPENLSGDCAILVRRDENLIASLTDAIEILRDDSGLRRRMGEAGKKQVEARDVAPYYQHFVKIIDEICGRSYAD